MHYIVYYNQDQQSPV